MTGLFSDISTKRSALIVAKNAYSQASRDLELALAGTDPYKIKAQKALVAQAEAQVASAQSGLSKTIIVAPFTGVVGTVDLSLGETVSIGKTVVSMIATDGYEVEAKIPEIDIVKVKVGQLAEVTLDAYGKDIVFPATITRINPTATTEGTVPVYKVIVTFTGKDDRIRQGMTATMQIITETKVNSIAIPARFVTILTSEEGTVVVARKEKEETVKVTLGIRGTDGLIEVKDGLHTDDVLVAPQTTSRQAQKQTN
jgi:RND family efflux transporter MFP subunit